MFKLLVLSYYLLCVGYMFLVVRRKKENRLITTLLIVFLPIFGYVLTLYLFKSKKQTDFSESIIEDVQKENIQVKNRGEFLQPVNIEEEINVIPIEDALLLNENKIKRKLLIHSLKENAIQNTKVLEKALQSDDSETSHYAASAIMEMKRKLVNSIQELSAQYEANKDDIRVMTSYAEAISQYLKNGLLDEGTYKQYQSLQSEVLEKILNTGKGEPKHFINKINCDLGLLQYEKASHFSDLFLQEHSNDEMAYIMAMKLSYELQNPTNIQRIVMTLKKQPVKLSAQGLSIIRFWL